MAKAAIVTRRRGPSSRSCPASDGNDPMAKEPAGIATITGQATHSREPASPATSKAALNAAVAPFGVSATALPAPATTKAATPHRAARTRDALFCPKRVSYPLALRQHTPTALTQVDGSREADADAREAVALHPNSLGEPRAAEEILSRVAAQNARIAINFSSSGWIFRRARPSRGHAVKSSHAWSRLSLFGMAPVIADTTSKDISGPRRGLAPLLDLGLYLRKAHRRRRSGAFFTGRRPFKPFLESALIAMASRTVADDRPALGIVFILVSMCCISVNDMLIKRLSGDYPLHQMVFVRSAIGIGFSLVILQFEGGFKLLRTNHAWLHALRGLCIVASNIAFFAALAVIPLADATALFFVAPLFITLLSIPFLGEKVGPRRIGAVIVGFIGVLIMLRPGAEPNENAPDRIVLLLPVFAAFAYASMQILTRRLGVDSKASAMAVYIQAMFLLVSLVFWLIAGDGRYAEHFENPSLVFLFRPWTWPEQSDLVLFLLLGLMSGIIGYSLSQAYRVASAATIAPFEYTAVPLAIIWGWVVFGHLPSGWVFAGIALITLSGVYVFLREGVRARQVASGRPVRRL